MLISIAWKNIWRNKKRSLIIIAAICFGLWGGLMSGGIMMGMGESMVNSAIDRDLSHIQIHKEDYLKDKEIINFIPDGKQLIKDIIQIPGVKAVSGRTLIFGMASSPASSFGAKIIGIDPDNAKKVTNISQYLIAGDYFESEYRNPIIIGKKLAERLNLKLRSKMVLSFQGLDGEISYTACKVSGIYKTESAPFDEMNVFVQQKDLYRILKSEPIFHEIAVRVEKSEIIPRVDNIIKTQYPNFQVQNWKEIAPDIAFLMDLMQQFSYLFVAIILFALLFGITNTMLMSVMERVRELGVLIAVGMKKGKVFSMILLETIFLSLTGGIAGIAIGSLSITIFSHTGIDLSAFSASLNSFGAGAMLYPFLPFAMYIILTFMIVFAANMAAIMPAWKAIHLVPSEAIRSY